MLDGVQRLAGSPPASRAAPEAATLAVGNTFIIE